MSPDRTPTRPGGRWLAALAALLGGCATEPPAPSSPPPAPVVVAAPAPPKGPPDPSTIPAGELGQAIRQGRELAERTPQLLPDHVGADLRCSSCHLGAGTTPGAGPWVGLAGVFPEYRARDGEVIGLPDRINDCFERSLNGRPLPADSAEMTALVAYMTWLSQGVPVGTPPVGRGFARLDPNLVPDPAAGAALYPGRCAACHGAEGQGLKTPDGQILYPPLWGDRSFNLGAGMARLDTAAAFVHANMPLGQGGTLKPQEALDLAAYFTQQPRPDWARKADDWPKGGKPRDARY